MEICEIADVRGSYKIPCFANGCPAARRKRASGVSRERPIALAFARPNDRSDLEAALMLLREEYCDSKFDSFSYANVS